ncbi:hypothetical protein MOW08_06805 [Acinetobacter schindleri]|nr:hypothetical protein MOW08_06805 [Acinetobacter schindleri]
MTMILQCKGTITDQNAPFLALYDDIESKSGSLFLWDAQLAKLSALPDIGQPLPNVLSAFNHASDKAFTFVKGSSASTDAYAKRELTAKGALHFMVSQSFAETISGLAFFGIEANSALQAELFNKIMGGSSNIYFSIWQRVTRIGQNRGGFYGPMIAYGPNTNNFAFYIQSKQNNIGVASGSTSESKLGVSAVQSAALAPNLLKTNIKSFSGTGITASTKLLIGSGVMAPWNVSQAQNESPSFAVYRIYIEDLSLSGRTYEQVKAIDDAEFNKEFGVGGRFYGDTWSNPATVLP